MKREIMSAQKLQESLAVRDLTDPSNGEHAINQMVARIYEALGTAAGWPKPTILRGDPITTVRDNMDRLYFPQDNLSRSSTYTRYVEEERILRTHTTCHIPDWIRAVEESGIDDVSVLVPGICYRRDVVDRNHCGEPHQLDIWRLRRGIPRLQRPELLQLVETVIRLTIPGARYRANEVKHPYTINGLEIEIETASGWLELLECGEALPQLLADNGLNPEEWSGLASGIGLDRLIMLAKGIDDIRLLRATDPRIATQMKDLNPYKPVSRYPSVTQDISVCVPLDLAEEDVCERVREAALEESIVEGVEIKSETSYDNVPPAARQRLGMLKNQKNLLIRIVLRSFNRSLRQNEANEVRDRLYRALHEGNRGYVV